MRSAIFAAVLFASVPALTHAGEEVVVVVGRSQTITVPFALGEGTNSNPHVLRAVVDPRTRQITFFGVGTGSATYTVIDARLRSHMITYEIRVVGRDLGREQQCLQGLFDDGGVLPGEVPDPCDDEPNVSSLCDADADATVEARESCERIAAQLHDVGGIRIHASGDDVVVDGEVSNPNDMDRVNAAVAAEHER